MDNKKIFIAGGVVLLAGFILYKMSSSDKRKNRGGAGTGGGNTTTGGGNTTTGGGNTTTGGGNTTTGGGNTTTGGGNTTTGGGSGNSTDPFTNPDTTGNVGNNTTTGGATNIYRPDLPAFTSMTITEIQNKISELQQYIFITSNNREYAEQRNLAQNWIDNAIAYINSNVETDTTVGSGGGNSSDPFINQDTTGTVGINEYNGSPVNELI